MAKHDRDTRLKAVKAALGSVRAEGLNPSQQIQDDLYAYAEGRIDINIVRIRTLQRIINKWQKTGE